jgi:hypothetical protein
VSCNLTRLCPVTRQVGNLTCNALRIIRRQSCSHCSISRSPEASRLIQWCFLRTSRTWPRGQCYDSETVLIRHIDISLLNLLCVYARSLLLVACHLKLWSSIDNDLRGQKNGLQDIGNRVQDEQSDIFSLKVDDDTGFV